MRAIQVHEFGGPEVLVMGDVPDLAAGQGQAVISLAAADVIYLDTLLRSGWGQDIFPRELPYVPGGGGAGRVASVGAGVDAGLVGRPVVARAAIGYAEEIVADVDDLVELPDGVDAAQAASLLHDGVTALSLLREGEIKPDEWVLVAAAAGGAGSLLVQLARDAGAKVVAAARGERKLALARELGADVAIDYSHGGWQQRVRQATGGSGVDLAYDGVGGPLGRAVFETVVEGGRFLTYGTSDGGFAQIDTDEAARRRVRVVNMLEAGSPGPAAVRTALGEALDLTAKGRLRPAIGATYPLADAAKAHTALAERRTIGKSLLLV